MGFFSGALETLGKKAVEMVMGGVEKNTEQAAKTSEQVEKDNAGQAAESHRQKEDQREVVSEGTVKKLEAAEGHTTDKNLTAAEERLKKVETAGAVQDKEKAITKKPGMLKRIASKIPILNWFVKIEVSENKKDEPKKSLLDRWPFSIITRFFKKKPSSKPSDQKEKTPEKSPADEVQQQKIQPEFTPEFDVAKQGQKTVKPDAPEEKSISFWNVITKNPLSRAAGSLAKFIASPITGLFGDGKKERIVETQIA